jgi:hypothetical protein
MQSSFQDLTKEVNMSLWKKFTLVFALNNTLRALVIGLSIWFLGFSFKLGDSSLIVLAIFIVIIACTCAILTFLQTFLGQFYIVPEHFQRHLEQIEEDIKCLQEITEMQESTTKASLEEAYFKMIGQELTNLRKYLK